MGVINLGKINGQDFKAIVSIPGWQADKIWERDETSLSELAKIYTASVWAYACITLRADALAGLEWEITPWEDKDSPLSDDHPLVTLLHEVNPEMNWNDLARSLENDMDIYGVAYWEKVRGGRSGQPKGLMRLNPTTMQLKADSTGIQGFIQRVPGAQQYERLFQRKDVVYFREYHPSNDLGGLSKLSVAMAAASAGINTAEYTAAFFKNYAVPPLVFSTDQNIDESTLDKMVDWWRRRFSGKSQQHKAGFTTHGMKPNIIGYPTKDLALGELLNEVRRDICAVFRVPPALAGAWEAANYATAKEQMRFLQTGTMKPRCEYLSGVLEGELFREFELGLRMRWRFDKLDVMAEDKKSEAERHGILVREGIEDPISAAEELEVEPAKEPKQREFPVFAQQPRTNGRGEFQEEMRQFERFAVNRVKRGQPFRVFNTSYIPKTLKRSIEGQLEQAKSAMEVKEIFHATGAWGDYPGVEVPHYGNGKVVEDGDMDKETRDEIKGLREDLRAVVSQRNDDFLKAILALVAGRQEKGGLDGLTIHTDQVDYKPEVKLVQPPVVVNVPEQPAPIVNVEVKAAPPTIQVSVPKQAAPVVNVDARPPKLTGHREQSKVRRDKKGQLLGHDSEVIYDYDK